MMAEKQDISSQFGGTLKTPVGSGKYGRHGRRFWIILAAWILLVLACGGAGYYYLTHVLPSTQKTESASTATAKPTTDPATTYAIVTADATAKKTSGDLTGAAQVYTTAAAAAPTSADKEFLYSSATVIFYNAGKYDSSLQPAIDAFNAAPSEGSAEMVANIYEHLGNKAQAIAYYQKALDLVSPNDPASYGTDYYQARINSLK